MHDATAATHSFDHRIRGCCLSFFCCDASMQLRYRQYMQQDQRKCWQAYYSRSFKRHKQALNASADKTLHPLGFEQTSRVHSFASFDDRRSLCRLEQTEVQTEYASCLASSSPDSCHKPPLVTRAAARGLTRRADDEAEFEHEDQFSSQMTLSKPLNGIAGGREACCPLLQCDLGQRV